MYGGYRVGDRGLSALVVYTDEMEKQSIVRSAMHSIHAVPRYDDEIIDNKSIFFICNSDAYGVLRLCTV